MTDPFFFGYGSLVNTDSHAYTPTFPAYLPGWRRRWQATVLRPAAFLTAYRSAGSGIDGLIAPVPGGDWAALDMRERGYERLSAPEAKHELGAETHVSVYAIARRPASSPCPILRSYLDVVVKGFHDRFGLDGVARFMETTDGWTLPVADDRAAPLYARAQDIGASTTALTDQWLDRLNVRVLPVEDTILGRAAS